MIPTRTRFGSWDIPSVKTAATSVQVAGEDVETAVHLLRGDCANLPELRVWEGQAHEAALNTLTRTAQHATFFGDIGDDTAGVLVAYHDALASVKSRIDGVVQSIEEGPLYVGDKWIVLLKPEEMDAERAKVLQTAQAAWQEQLNPLITELGKADDDAANKLKMINYRYSEVNLDPHDPYTWPRPDDGVPDPQYEAGRQAQVQLQQEEAALTIREVEGPDVDRDGVTTTTVTMQDGSKQVMTTTASYIPKGPFDEVIRSVEIDPATGKPLGTPPKGWEYNTASWYDPKGNLVSKSSTAKDPESGLVVTKVDIPGEMHMEAWERANGERGGYVRGGPDNKTYDLPEDDTIFTHPNITGAGGVVTALESYTGKGGGIPVLSNSQISGLGVGSKFAGPGLGLATTGWDVIHEGTMHDKCVAGTSGLIGTAGSWAAGTAAASIAPGPWSAAAASGAASVGGAWGFGWLGKVIGEEFVCK